MGKRTCLQYRVVDLMVIWVAATVAGEEIAGTGEEDGVYRSIRSHFSSQGTGRIRATTDQ